MHKGDSITAGTVYRRPNTNVGDDKYTTMNSLEKWSPPCYNVCNHNLDLLEDDKHSQTATFLDLMYGNY